MTEREAIEIMCDRCSNAEMCQKTGCYPKMVLIDVLAEREKNCKDKEQE